MSERLTRVHREEGAFFDHHWRKVMEAGDVDLVVPPDAELFQEDLGRSLAYMLARMGDLDGARATDLGCGPGDYTIFVARHGATVDAVDIARSALEITRQRAAASGVGDRVRTHLMGAERLGFADDAFDLVLGFGLLHHADLTRLGPEMRRVLKPGGRALFREPLGAGGPAEVARRYLPYRGKYHSRHERALTYADVAVLGRSFDAIETREFYLLSSISRLLGSERSWLFRRLYALDEALLRRFPRLRPWCRYVVVEAQG